MGLLDQIAPAVNQIFDMVKDEESIAVSLIYKRYTGQKNGVDQFDEINISSDNCLKLKHNEKSIAILGDSNTNLNIGDVLYMIKGNAFPSTYSLKDTVSETNGPEQQISKITPVFGLLYVVSIVGV